MSHTSSSVEPVVFVLAACQAPGADIARVLAARGRRVILVDADGKALTRIAAQNPDQIETLVINGCVSNVVKVLKDAWGSEPLCMVLNLMPLAQPDAIAGQMRNLTSIMSAMMRGLVAGRGSLVSLVARPTDPLALVSQGMFAAMQGSSAALASVVGKHNVRVHVLSLPPEEPEVAIDTILFLSTPDAEQIASTTFELG